MKNSIKALLAVGILATALTAQAKDEEVILPISGAMHSEAASKLDPSIRINFGGGSGLIKRDLTSRWPARAFGRTEEEACNWAFINNLIQIQKAAKKLGATSVSNIRTYYKKNQPVTGGKFVCHAGSVVARVTMKADANR